MKICLVIYKLDFGGSQRQIFELSKALADAGHDVTLMSCYEGGVFSEEIKCHTQVNYVSLNKKGRFDVFGFLFCFLLQLRKIRPDVIYGFLSLANIISVFAKILLPKVKVVFGVRASNIDLKKYGFSMWAAFHLECFFSRFADRVIANSIAGKTYYRKAFSFPSEISVVPNGINTEIFKPDSEKRAEQRAVWKVPEHGVLVGIVGRMDPMKGYSFFLKAAALASQKHSDIFFVCAGDGPESYVQELKALADRLGVAGRIVWTGYNSDMTRFYNAVDIFTSASVFGEGFSNGIGEALATGVFCVVTDVGDSAAIVGNCGIAVPPGDPETLVAGWEEAINKDSSEAKDICIRQWVLDHFSLKKLVKRTEKVFFE